MIFADGFAGKKIYRPTQKTSVPAEHYKLVGTSRIKAEFAALVHSHSACFAVFDGVFVHVRHTVGNGVSVSLSRQRVTDAQMVAERYRGISCGGIAVDEFSDGNIPARAEFRRVAMSFYFINVTVLRGSERHREVLSCMNTIATIRSACRTGRGCKKTYGFFGSYTALLKYNIQSLYPCDVPITTFRTVSFLSLQSAP